MGLNRLGVIAILAGLGLVSAGCQTVSAVNGVVVAHTPSFTNEVLEARAGDLIAIQRYQPLITVEAQEGVELTTGIGTDIGFEAGDQFYLAESQLSGQFFCLVMDEPRSENLVLLRRSRPCMQDTDADYRFDSAWRMNEVGYDLRIDGGEVFQAVELLDTPIPYRSVAPTQDAIAEHGLWLRRGALGGWYIIAAIRGISDNPVAFSARTDLPSADELPARVSVMGTTLEILESEGDVLRYRVISQPPMGTQSSVYRVVTTTYVYY